MNILIYLNLWKTLEIYVILRAVHEDNASKKVVFLIRELKVTVRDTKTARVM